MKEAPSRASRSRAATSGRSEEGSGGRGDWLALLTPPIVSAGTGIARAGAGYRALLGGAAGPSLPTQRRTGPAVTLGSAVPPAAPMLLAQLWVAGAVAALQLSCRAMA
ncbi:hypothetical protein GCM10010244_00150 [Streptomyces coeruleorubidus]|nr:hypothetical protein GCM10010244_00150 [Streptomyces bellus]